MTFVFFSSDLEFSKCTEYITVEAFALNSQIIKENGGEVFLVDMGDIVVGAATWIQKLY